jgi:pimeloyl-ACP methyl ester carboxylesterase
VARCEGVVPSGMAWPAPLPRPPEWSVTALGSSPVSGIGGLDQAHRYLTDAERRERTVASLRGAIAPVLHAAHRPVVVIGHSLGAIVALDVLAGIDAEVDLLVTLGAPLGHRGIADRLLDDDLDVRRLGAWLNVIHLLDPIAMGRGAAALFPAASDAYLPVLAGGRGLTGFARGLARAATAHLDTTYLSADVVRSVVAETLAGASWCVDA